MTRGQIAIITKNEIMTSNEFNGGMYPSHYGKIVVNGLRKVKDVADYQYFVAKFNKEHHHYNDLEQVCFKIPFEADYLDFSKGYFDKWFSDYIYIKNLSGEDVEIITKSGENKVIPDNAIARLYFGELEHIFKDLRKEVK